MRHLLFNLAIVALFGQPVLAGSGSHSGRERGIWTDDRTSVIVATIKDIKKLKDRSNYLYSATLVPKVTLAGSFDPSLNPALHVRFFADGPGTSIPEPPADGLAAIVVVRTGRFQADETEPSDWISPMGWEFMPDSQALVVIKGLDDPRVEQTLKKIQEARAHPDPDPDAPKPVTKPDGTPKPK